MRLKTVQSCNVRWFVQCTLVRAMYAGSCNVRRFVHCTLVRNSAKLESRIDLAGTRVVDTKRTFNRGSNYFVFFLCAAELGSPEDLSAVEMFCVVSYRIVLYCIVLYCIVL